MQIAGRPVLARKALERETRSLPRDLTCLKGAHLICKCPKNVLVYLNVCNGLDYNFDNIIKVVRTGTIMA
jgi:hypothetical protein